LSASRQVSESKHAVFTEDRRPEASGVERNRRGRVPFH